MHEAHALSRQGAAVVGSERDDDAAAVFFPGSNEIDVPASFGESFARAAGAIICRTTTGRILLAHDMNTRYDVYRRRITNLVREGVSSRN